MHTLTEETHQEDVLSHHQGAPLRWRKASRGVGPPSVSASCLLLVTLSDLIYPAPGRPGTALPATRWARLREHRIALNLDSSVPRRFSPAAYSSWTDGKMGGQCRPHPREQAQATYDSLAGPEGKEMRAAPWLCSLHRVELDTIHTSSGWQRRGF